MRLNRKWRIAISLLLCICMAFSFVGSVSAAELLPFIIMPPLPLISSILVASGIVPNDETDFKNLCTSIDTELQLGPLRMTVSDKKTYIDTSVATSVLESALRRNAYSPQKKSSYTVNGQSYRYVAKSAEFYAYIRNNFVPVASVSSIPDKDTWVPLMGGYGWLCFKFDSTSMRLILKTSFIGADTYYTMAARNYGNKCWQNDWVLPIELGDIVYSEEYKKLYFTLRCSAGDVHSGTISRDPVVGGSISVRFPWEVTDDLPGVSVAGTLDSINSRWLALEREFAGARAIPISVPALTVAGAAAQTQVEAQSGTKTKDVAFDVVDSAAAGGFFAQGKFSFALSDFFPFCIPFDIIKGVKLLVAPAKDPVFDIPIKFPYIPQQTIHVNLTQFAGIAVISRWFLTLVFVWSLAAGTSKVMKW